MTDELPLYPFCVEEIERSSRTWFSETLCRFMIVTIVTEGDVVYRFEEKEHLITPGKILIVPQNASYFFKNGPSGGYKKVVAEFMGKNLQSIMETLGLNRFPDPRSRKLRISCRRGQEDRRASPEPDAGGDSGASGAVPPFSDGTFHAGAAERGFAGAARQSANDS